INFNYDDTNRRTSMSLSNGISISYGYDSNSQITGITYNFGATVLGSLSYVYDQLGQRTQVAGSFARTNLPQPLTSAAYVSANELINWNGFTLSYDNNGSMLSDGTNNFTWDTRGHLSALNGSS